MSHTKLAGAVIALLIIPLAALAQTATTTGGVVQQRQAARQQIAVIDPIGGSEARQKSQNVTTANIGTICSITRYPIRRGMSGVDVQRLQLFLKGQGFFTANVTGYFGPLTESALTRFQLQVGIISRASEGGVFGPKTFQFIVSHSCTKAIQNPPIDTGSSPPPVSQCTPPPQPTLSCTGTWQKIFSGSNCHVGWTCVESSTVTNKPPLISAIVGPTHLKPDESGTWRVDATDPEHDALAYSVVWGDEGANLSRLLTIAHEGTPFSSATSFSHSYKNTGTYTIVVFAKDATGNYTTATLSISVSSPVDTNPPVNPDGSCLLNGTTTQNGKTIPNPACPTSGTCNYPYLQCVSGQWVAIPAGGGSGSLTGACFLNGQGYEAETIPAECGIRDGGALTQGNQKEQCTKYISGQPICTDNGWANISWGGGYINPSNVTVGCTSSNTMQSPYAATGPIYVPGNMRVFGNRCTETNSTPPCDAFYICKRDGWWFVDGAGFETKKVNKLPFIIPENFYPQFPPAY